MWARLGLSRNGGLAARFSRPLHVKSQGVDHVQLEWPDGFQSRVSFSSCTEKFADNLVVPLLLVEG